MERPVIVRGRADHFMIERHLLEVNEYLVYTRLSRQCNLHVVPSSVTGGVISTNTAMQEGQRKIQLCTVVSEKPLKTHQHFIMDDSMPA